MANVQVKNGAGDTKYLKASGVGTDLDPHIPQHLETNSAAILAAVDGVEAALAGTLTVGLPSGAATAANQATIIGHVDGLEAAASAIQTAVQLIDDAIYVDDVPFAAGTAKLIGVGAVLDDAAPNTVTEGDVAMPRISSRRELYIQIRDAQGNERGLRVDANGAIAVTNAGLTTLAGAVTGTEMQVDVVGALPAGDNNIGNVDIASALPAGTNNIGDVDVLSIAAGTNTIGATRDAGPAWTPAFGVSSARVTSADATGIVAVTDAPTSGQKIVLDDIIISVGATAMLVDVQEETSATKLISVYMAANSTVQITPRGKIKLATADKKVCIDTSAAGNVAVTAIYHSEA